MTWRTRSCVQHCQSCTTDQSTSSLAIAGIQLVSHAHQRWEIPTLTVMQLHQLDLSTRGQQSYLGLLRIMQSTEAGSGGCSGFDTDVWRSCHYEETYEDAQSRPAYTKSAPDHPRNITLAPTRGCASSVTLLAAFNASALVPKNNSVTTNQRLLDATKLVY